MFLELDTEALNRFMNKHGISKAALSKKLGVCPKTIQRWRTGSVKRIKPETLSMLATALNVSTMLLTQRNGTRIAKRYNRELEEICTENFIQEVRLSNNWKFYQNWLKTFNSEGLSKRQKMLLFKSLGVTAMFLRKVKASKYYLEAAMVLAKELKSIDDQILITNWNSARALISGKLPEALKLISISQDLLTKATDIRCTEDFLFKKSRILHVLERTQEAVTLTRQAILLNYSSAERDLISISNKYTYLGDSYLRLCDFKNALISYKRAEKAACQSGWVMGQYYCKLGLAITNIFTSNSISEAWAHFGRARRFHQNFIFLRLNTQVDQFRFLYHLFNHNEDETKKIITRRLADSSHVPMHHASAIIDAIIASKIYPGSVKVRSSLIEKTASFLRNNELNKSLNLLTMITSKENLTLDEVRAHYQF